jgi:hypothetical protein
MSFVPVTGIGFQLKLDKMTTYIWILANKIQKYSIRDSY